MEATKKEFKKQPIKFLSHEFNLLKKDFEVRQIIENKIIEELKNLLGNDVQIDSNSLFNNVKQYFYTLVGQVYEKQNTMGLKPEKLAVLFDLDTSNLDTLIERHNSYKKYNKPTKECFTIYTKNEAENERLELSKSTTDFLNEISKKHSLTPLHIYNGMRGLVEYDMSKQIFIPSMQYITNSYR